MKTHGLRKHELYKTWTEMRYRCENPKKHNYQSYGGRGIKVCERWQDFANFVADMAPRPPGHTLERRDNGGPYSPGNCYWATRRQQMSNTRSNRFVTWRGERMTLSEAARKSGIYLKLLHKRVGKLGWSVERALETPIRSIRAIGR